MTRFLRLDKSSDIPYGLTELNAADAVHKGFMTHNDWLAHVARYGHIADYIEKTHASRVIDIGCGKLNLPKYLWRNRYTFNGTYVGVDLRATEAWLKEYEADRIDVTLIRADILNPKLSLVHPGDIVVCTEVLEHVPRDRAQELFESLYKRTCVGGTLFLSSPNAGVSDSIAKNHVGPEGSREWMYDEKIEMGENAGFKFQRAYGTFITIKHIPPSKLADPFVVYQREFLPYAWFSVLMAAPYPRESNNCLMVFKR
jgi:2-polyprenyl-3-methyl-5-hydroxy-6-metoxy-1,4-benzoquinol methylase